MKIIEAMKKIKANRTKISDLQTKIKLNSAHLSHETPTYENPRAKIKAWEQSCIDLVTESIVLLIAISRTNLATEVTVQFSTQKPVTKTIAEWVWRRREFVSIDRATYISMTDRGLKGGQMQSSTETPIEVSVVTNFEIEHRDKKLETLLEEPMAIDAALEVANATTDLILDQPAD